MAITTRPYDGNNVAGDDGPYSAQDWRDVWHSLFGGDDGTTTNSPKRGILFGVGGNLRVQPSTPAAKSVQVLGGAALIQGMWFESDDAETISISANASGSTRYDVIVAQYDDTAGQNVGDITVVEGTPGAGIPALTQSLAGIYQIPLAILTLTNGYATVTAAEIEDARALSNAPQATAIPLQNKSGADLYAGDVVIQDTSNANAVTTTTTANSRVAGVVVGWGANNAYVQVVQNGLAWVKVAGAVAIGDRLIHSTTAKKAKAGVDFTAFGVALQSGTDTIILAAINVPPLNNILTTRGDILIRDANGLTRLAIGANGTVLSSNGTDPSWGSSGAVDDFFPFINRNSAAPGNVGAYTAPAFNAANDAASCVGYAKATVSAAYAVVLPQHTSSSQVDFFLDAGASGENYNNHTTSSLNQSKALTTNVLNEWDVSAMFTGLGIGAGDYFGFYVSADDADANYWLGLRLEY